MILEDYRSWQLALLLLMLWMPSQAQITIQNNAYSGILVAIHDDVEEDTNLLQGIRDAFTEASQFLYQITRNRAYFSEITVLIPPSWSSNPIYQPLGNERFENSHFRILNTFPEDQRPSVFRTSTDCGRSDSNAYGQFSPAHFIDSQRFEELFISYRKEIVYQWARIRFGVFDESPQGTEPNVYPVDGGNAFEGSRCSLQIPGENRQPGVNGLGDCDVGGVENNICIFIPENPVPGVFGSLMYHQGLDHVSEFCDEDSDSGDRALVHNQDPTNAQNTHCAGRSVWEVIRSHLDYAQMDPLRQVTATQPTFRFVESRPTSVVLVLDTSESMLDHRRIQRLAQGVIYFLQNVPNGIAVGMVRFAQTASTLLSITTMSDATRQQIIDAVPTRADGFTSIGAGITRALDLLEAANIQGGILIVVSDGNENRDPRIPDTYERISQLGVTIHTVAISDEADEGLETVAQRTGGDAYFSLDDDTSNAIIEAFIDIAEHLTTGAVDESHPIALHSLAFTLGGNGVRTVDVMIDDTLGFNTEITFDYSHFQRVDISLQTPSNRIYSIQSPECNIDSNRRIIRCTFAQNSETGIWRYAVTNRASASQRISVIIRSQPRDPENPPIVARAFWAYPGIYSATPGAPNQRIHATVSKGLNPVLNAAVIARVATASRVSQLTLEDNGAGADLNKDDGIYSAFFVSLSTDGRYTVQVSVDGTSVTTTSLQTILGTPSSASTSKRRKRDTYQTTGQFQRVASGGTFRAVGTASLTAAPYPPGRITDLRVARIDTARYRVTLQWTAQGDRLDLGRAAEYEIRRGYKRNLSANYSLILPADVVQGNLSAPATAGTMEEFTLQLPTEENLFYVGVVPKAVDSTAADLSNVVSFTTKPITLASLGVATPTPTNTSSYITIGIPVGCAVLAIVLLSLAVVIHYRCRKERRTAPATTP